MTFVSDVLSDRGLVIGKTRRQVRLIDLTADGPARNGSATYQCNPATGIRVPVRGSRFADDRRAAVDHELH
jgi:hypothetical protein